MVRIFRGGVLDERFEGSVVVIGPRPTTMTGLVRGDLFVRDSSVCDVTGMVSGNLLAERTGKAVLRGLVTKAAKAAGGDLEVRARPGRCRQRGRPSLRRQRSRRPRQGHRANP